jgi:hypothetical protein
MSAINSIRVKAGRNIGSTPMSDTSWNFFTSTLIHLASFDYDSFKKVLFTETQFGKGEWQGVEEENFEVFMTFTKEPTLTDMSIVNELIAKLGRIYEQDAVSVTWGITNLV